MYSSVVKNDTVFLCVLMRVFDQDTFDSFMILTLLQYF